MRSICFFILILISGTAFGKDPELIPRASVYAGGINRLTDLLVDKNSDEFRGKGGGLYLHHSAWTILNNEQQTKLLKIFKDSPITIEIGSDKGTIWPRALKRQYIDKGIKPHFVAVNFFDGSLTRTYDDWRIYHEKIKEVVPKRTLVLPIYAPNTITNKNTLLRLRVSQSKDFKRMIKLSKGLVIDTPPLVFLNREPGYKQWVIDAIQYTNKSHTTVVIISPDKSGGGFKKHTSNYLRILSENNALPKVYVVENYIGGNNYKNKIGSEDSQTTIMGIAKNIINSPKR